MIETPANPSNRLLADPPPDPRHRVPDPPPDPGSRYEHACAECGIPLHPDQAACLNCGTMVKQDDGGAGIRRAALSSVTALLVLGGAVGAAVAGLPHGKDVPKSETAQVFGNKGPSGPATAGAPKAPTSPTTPVPGGDTASKPPPIAPEKPSATKGGSPSTSAGSGGTGSTGGSTGGTSGNKTSGKKDTKPKEPKPLKLFDSGLPPAQASEFAGSAKPTTAADHTADTNAKTAWKTSATGIGIIVEPASPPYKALGIVSSTKGYGVKVYFTNKSTPPSDVKDWGQIGSTSSADPHQRFKFPKGARNADHYLVWIIGLPTGGKVSINEIQLFQ